jgi:hypothetical protein
MSEIQRVQTVFVPYSAGDLRKAFKAQIELHHSQAEIHPMGQDGFHESLKRRAEESLKALNSQTMNDTDILTFPTLLSDFGGAVSPSGSLVSFLDYHNKGRIGMLTLREANQLGLIRSFS